MAFLTRYRDDPSAPSLAEAGKDLLRRAVLPAVLLWLAICAFGWVLVHGPLKWLSTGEEEVNYDLEDWRTPTWNGISDAWTTIGDTPVIIGTAIVISLLVWWLTKQWWLAIIPIIAIALQSSVFVGATLVLGRDRPDASHLDEAPPTSSYPSGHEGATTALYLSFLLLALQIRNRALRAVLIVICVLAPFLVGFSRVYRGMHHVTDVTVGMLNGIACALLAWGYLRRDPSARTDHTSA